MSELELVDGVLKKGLHSYPSVFALGHAHLGELLLDDVLVEEKVDGSQFSFGKIDGKLRMRSKGQEIHEDHPEGMFVPAVSTARALFEKLTDGWTYRGEFLNKPKHNTIEYARVPDQFIILFDVNPSHEAYLSRAEKEAEAARIGLEIVPVFYQGKVTSAEQLLQFMERDSCLGGAKIEGFVIKNYQRFGRDKKALMGKYVSEAFKETNKENWKGNKTGITEFTELLVQTYKTEARWRKAVQHLRELGKLEGSPRDIGILLKEVHADILKECGDEIKEKLLNHVRNTFSRGVVRGLPEWYKRELLNQQFTQTNADQK